MIVIKMKIKRTDARCITFTYDFSIRFSVGSRLFGGQMLYFTQFVRPMQTTCISATKLMAIDINTWVHSVEFNKKQKMNKSLVEIICQLSFQRSLNAGVVFWFRLIRKCCWDFYKTHDATIFFLFCLSSSAVKSYIHDISYFWRESALSILLQHKRIKII